MHTPALEILEARKEAGLGNWGRAGLMAATLAGGAHGVEQGAHGGYNDISGKNHSTMQMARSSDHMLADTGHPLASYDTGGLLKPGTLPTGKAMDAANQTHQALKERATDSSGLLNMDKVQKFAPHSLPILNKHLQGQGQPTIAPYSPPAVASR